MSTLQRELAEFAAIAGFLEANHLDKVGDELTELKDAPADRLEMADVVLALMLHAEQHGIDLMAAAHEKLAIVKTRTYGEPDERGVVRHVADGCGRHGIKNCLSCTRTPSTAAGLTQNE